MTLVQVSNDVDDMSGLPVDEWLTEQVTDSLERRSGTAEGCDPEQVDITGSALAMMCVYNIEGAFVSALVSAVHLDARLQVISLVKLRRDPAEDVSTSIMAATEMAGASIVAVLS
jgi:hypothetical protein